MRQLSRTLGEQVYGYFLQRRRARFGEAHKIEGVRIISVGNLTLGGTGKTPCVQWLARRLRDDSFRVGIVARGYGGKLSNQGAIVSDGREIFLDADAAGDEALLHARATKLPIVIGRDRQRAVERARDLGCDVVILDDGFQYWSLARDFDLLLLDARRPFANGRLLPRGRLREEIDAVKRADAVVLTRSDRATARQVLAARAALEAHQLPVFTARHAPQVLAACDGNSEGEKLLSDLHATPVACLSAIADNTGFAREIERQGARVVAKLARRDHHRWQRREVEAFARLAREKGAQFLVTTSKDAVKIEPNWCAPCELWALQIEMEIEGADDLYRMVRAKLN